MARIVVGMSGGVDSSVVALLLKQQGHEVIGLFMRNWNEASVTLEDECPWIDDSRDAMMVAEQLGIPFQVLDLSEEYKERIVDYMFREYEKGKTPNPDVLCNREIKFDSFLKAALKLGADYVATGHYVQKAETETPKGKMYRLLAGADPNKDQSYFLCQLNQFQLSKALFPIGHLLKPEVRKIAEENNLVTAAKRDSQGLCFIGHISLPEFLQQQLKPKKGDVIEIPMDHPKIVEYRTGVNYPTMDLAAVSTPPRFSAEDGVKVGEHNGAHYFTIGQRKGLQIGGTEEPLFVIQTDVTKNIIYVGRGSEHPGLFQKAAAFEEGKLHWIRPDMELEVGESRDFLIRIRYRQQLFSGKIYRTSSEYFAVFNELQKSVTPGQFLALYVENELVASGVIA
ncbi:MAG: tRNA 2-thiouridine(34) synthase MnmA [Bacteroidetes bacterium]|nr:tRNA 2-thiouridine(34) synthase MnmA [Bacteroidota bacterium]